MKTIYLNSQTMPNEIKRLFERAFPGYSGRKFKMRGVSGPINMASYWSGGSREYFVVLCTDGTLDIPQQSAFDKEVSGATTFLIPDGFAVAQHTIFNGKDLGLTLIVPEERLTQLAPPVRTLSENQLIVLRITANYKSSYRRGVAASQGITAAFWAETVRELAHLGLLRKNGSISPEGRNAC